MGVVPPFVGVAVKFTLVPEQMEVALDTMDKAGVTIGLTVMVTPLEVAEAALRQSALLVITQVITLPLAKAADV